MSIVLQFSQGSDLSSYGIEWFEHGPAGKFIPSHVDIVASDGRLFGARSDSIGGAPPGVQYRAANYLASEKTLRVTIPTTPEQETAAWAFLAPQEGKPYDIEGIGGFIVGREWDKSDAWFCSELAAAALVSSGWLRKPYAPLNKIDPMDLLNLLSVLVPVE